MIIQKAGKTPKKPLLRFYASKTIYEKKRD